MAALKHTFYLLILLFGLMRCNNPTEKTVKKLTVTKTAADQYFATTLRSQKNLLEETRTANQVGLGFTVGTLIPLNKKWFVLTQFRADGLAGPTVIKTTDLLTGTTTSKTYTTFDFNAWAMISEVTLFYRF